MPLCCTYSEEGLVSKVAMENVHQRKGQAEMAVVDWLLTLSSELQDKEAAMSTISSGDIDAVLVHLFAVSLYWPREWHIHKSSVCQAVQRQLL